MAERQEPQPATAPDAATGNSPSPSAVPAFAARPGSPPPGFGASGAGPSGFGSSGFGWRAGPQPGPPGRFAPSFGPGHPAAPEQAGQAQVRRPSGLFPGLPPRPVYREPHPIRSGPLAAGVAAAILWFVLFGSLGHDLAGYAWWSIVAGITAWAVAIVLAVLGDRGVAAGIALASGFGLAIAMALVAARWITTYNWPLW